MVLKIRSNGIVKERLPEISPAIPDIPGGLAASLVRALMSPVPRPLLKIDAELIMFSGQYLLHYKGEMGGADHYKLLTPGALRAAFAGEAIDSGWLSPNVVRWGESTKGKYQVLWIPPRVSSLAVEGVVDGKRAVETLRVPLPGMVMAGIRANYYMWALAQGSFSPTAKAYFPPLPNIMDDGAVCWGENHPPAVSEQGGIERAWQLFLRAPFNDHMAGARTRSFPNDARGLLHQLAKKKPKTFPVGELLPFKKGYQGQFTIAQLVDSALKGGQS